MNKNLYESQTKFVIFKKSKTNKITQIQTYFNDYELPRQLYYQHDMWDFKQSINLRLFSLSL